MKINRVCVKDLFGMFTHEIPFNQHERITIIYGLNGIGKTAILRMINGFFNARYSDIRSTPFTEFTIWFDDASRVVITKGKRSNEVSLTAAEEPPDLFAEYHVPGQAPSIVQLVIPVKPEDFPFGVLENYIDGLSRIGSDLWRLGSTGELFNFEQLLERYADTPPFAHFEREVGEVKHLSNSASWLMHLRDAVDVQFIETQRLVSTSKSPWKRRRGSVGNTPAVARYSEEIAEVIQRRQSEYGAKSQELDRSFPIRVLQSMSNSPPPIEDLQQRLEAIEKRRVRLKQLGVLGKETNPNFQRDSLPANADEKTRNLLSCYIQDIEEKLGIFDDVSKRIETLIQFVNDHFFRKQLVIDTERGFVIKSAETDKELSLSQMSSGEQHELVLIYELLFRVKKNSLILIDEPEISLHVDWQLQFIDDIQSVLSLSSFDVLIATHSPLIINDRWNLAVELSHSSKSKNE